MFNIITGDKSGGKIINTIKILHIKHTQSHRRTDHHRDSHKHSHSQSHIHTHTYSHKHTHTHIYIYSHRHIHAYMSEFNDKTQLQRYDY